MCGMSSACVKCIIILLADTNQMCIVTLFLYAIMKYLSELQKLTGVYFAAVGGNLSLNSDHPPQPLLPQILPLYDQNPSYVVYE